MVMACFTLSFRCGSPSPPNGWADPWWFQSRQLEYLHFATETPLNPGSLGNLMAHLEREARDPGFDVAPGAVPDDAWDGVFDKMWRLRDTSDFDALRLVDMLYAFGGHPVAGPELWQKAQDALFTFKYWYADRTPERIVGGEQVVDNMWYWTENHILIFRTCEYLIGEMFPERIFVVPDAEGRQLTGREHADRAKAAILTWLDERAKFGFTEWHSNVYYNLDLRPLLSLVEWAPDRIVAKRASMVLDLVLLDVALHLHRGTFGATHGRSYIKDKPSASKEDTFDTAKMLFDDTDLPYGSRGSTSGAVWARAKKYRLPEVIRRIAQDDQPLTDRERMNLPLDEVPPLDPANTPPPEAPYGLDFQDEENLPFWWSMGSQPAWMIMPLTFRVADREGLFDAQFDAFQPLLPLVWVEGDIEATIINAQWWAQTLWPYINASMLKEVNTYTHRTKHYMLSTAQDYRKGVRGSQTHTWQATLSENAMVFTQHPSYLPVAPGDPIPPAWNWQQQDEPGPGYWTGESSQPRAAQVENVGISIYAPQYVANSAIGFDYREETHAYFPRAHFDEVVQQGPWTFGRKDDGYVALYSWRPTEWRGGQPDVHENAGLDFDLVAPGSSRNVWIVECGSADEWPGGFAEFVAAVAGAAVTVTPTASAFQVAYDSPSRGVVELGWEGPLVVEGEEVSIADYPRMDNRYATIAFGETRYEVDDGQYRLILDFEKSHRKVKQRYGRGGKGTPSSPPGQMGRP